MKIHKFINITICTFFLLDIINGAVLLEYSIGRPIPIKDEQNKCFFTFSVLVSHPEPLGATDFTINLPSYSQLFSTLVSWGINSTIQLFNFHTFQDYVATVDLGLIINTSSGPVPITVPGFKCLENTLLDFDINSFTLKKIGSPQMHSTKNIFVFLEYDFSQASLLINSYIEISCTTITPFVCYLAPVNQYPNVQILYISINKDFLTLPEEIPITLTLRGQDLKFNVSNIFPYNVTRTSVVIKEIEYPPSGANLTQDFQLLYYDLVSYLFIENSNSFFYIMNFGYGQPVFQPYILLQQNQTHSTYFQKMSFQTIATGTLIPVMLDNRITNISSDYNSTNQNTYINLPLNSSIGYVPNLDCYLGYSSFEMPMISKPVISTPYSFNTYLYFQNPYPYAYSNGSFTYSGVFPLSMEFQTDSVFITYTPGGISTINISKIRKTSNIVLYDVTYGKAQWYSFMARLNISSVCQVTAIQIGGSSFMLTPLIYGDYYNGIYEFEVAPSTTLNEYKITINDACSRQSIFTSSLLYVPVQGQSSLLYFPENVEFHIDIRNITYFKLSRNVFDLSNGDVNGTLYFNLSHPVKEMEPMFVISYLSSTFYGKYDSNLNLYIIDFTIPKGMMPGKMYYGIDVLVTVIESTMLESYFNDSVAITVTNSAGDFMDPILEEIHAFPNNNYSIGESVVEDIGWNLRITDFPNGFSFGTLDIISDHDLLPIKVNFSGQSSRISGNEFDGVYAIRFSVNGTCRTQTYTIANVLLYDNFAYKSEYLSNMNPLTSIFGSQYADQLKLQLNCLTSMIDNDAPIMTTFDFSPISVDVGSLNRNIKFSMKIKDVGPSGLSLRHSPIIQLASDNADLVQVTMNYISSINGEYVFESQYQLPYGFGMNVITVSIFGLVDNFKNYRGYNTFDLMNSTSLWPYSIQRTMTLTNPILERALKLTNKGGVLYVYGRNFGLDSSGFSTTINFQDGKGFLNVEFDSFFATMLKFNNIPPISSNNISMIVTKNGISSNELIIPIENANPNPSNTPTPTATPSTTPQPQKCPGTPECNNNGQCINSICKCYDSWYGPSCSSIPIPPAYPEPITGINITESGSLITTSIEIIGVRELDATMNVVQSFNISKWNFTDLSTTSSNPKYFYSTQLNQRSTLLNVSIEYFKNSGNITFAGEQLFIPASTIKFSMNMSHYDFKDQTNLIQILMKSSIQTDNSDACSSAGVGIVDKNVQWIKLNVDESSLYGRFLSKGVIDNRVSTIQNVIIEDEDEDQTKQMRSVIVGIICSSFEDSINLDPDFSNLIDVGSSDTSDFICSSSNKLSNGAIAGIVVGVIVLISIVVGSVLYIRKRKKFKEQELRMKQRLSNLNKDL
ncbi:hypothetical protein PPL_01219 [Heterostelium album PN500]|uniref:EGF-like domain-containing protein n=1 Tax=Heterostelium pallidum (strain ATCC 26659 / Pp 5 / PN500) TaxID=670386 RepID=D3AYF9_HETP5|nr:hypothetical protein PPL_01219 [Heterostelium album PN500]EFA85986.1 hypothetical protein PPL_01219 [Heterostelium album PN500]|eukprot:XP_020438092.1 hypothetical protein PPL_01219 [Heterostelium album PN500]